jgi:hypothetical protein
MIRIIVSFVFVVSGTVFNMEIVRTIIFYVRTKLLVPDFTNSIVMSIHRKIMKIHVVDILIYGKLQRSLRMPSSGMLCRVALVRTNVSEERSISIIRVAKLGERASVGGYC